MGKQINYYMEYDTFACVAEKAVELGCEIIKYNKDHEIVRGYSADLITKDCINYYFHIPEAGEIGIKKSMVETMLTMVILQAELR